MVLSWKEVRQREFAKVPKGSPFSEYMAAMKRASAIYRGVSEPAVKPTRRNPSHSARNNPRGDNLLLLAGLAVAGYFAYQYLQQHPELLQSPAPTAQRALP